MGMKGLIEQFARIPDDNFPIKKLLLGAVMIINLFSLIY